MLPHFTFQMAAAFFAIVFLVVQLLWLTFRRNVSLLNAVGEASVFYFAMMLPVAVWSLA